MVSKTGEPDSLTRARRRLCLLGGAAALHAATAAAQAPAPAPAAPSYRVIPLGSGSIDEIPAINAHGQVAFSLAGADGARAWFYDGNTVRAIADLGGGPAYAVGLDDAGQVAGFAATAAGVAHAFRWSAAGGTLDLGVIRGGPESQAAAINNSGWVVGYSDTGSVLQPGHAFLWRSAATGIEDLGNPLGDGLSVSSATAVNDAGLVAGDADLGAPSFNTHAFAWTQGTGMVDLGTLGGATSYAVAVDARGEVTGWSNVADGNNHAFLWSRALGIRDLGTAGGTESFPLAMSPTGQVVGVIDFADGNQHAMSWTAARGMVDLGTLAGTSSRAIALNRLGQVVGNAGTDRKSEPLHAFLWSAARGMLDLNRLVGRLPAGLWLESADAISDSGEIVAETNAGPVLLKPNTGQAGAQAGGPLPGPIAGADLVAAGAPFAASASFVGDAGAAPHRLRWTWGDGTGESAAAPGESGGAGSGSAQHVYARPGVYTVTAQVTDRAGNSATISRNVVVVDPSARHAAGAGAFVSPPGALPRAPGRSGTARFAFFAPGAGAGAGTSTGTGARAKPLFLFDSAGLHLRSEDFKPVSTQAGAVRFEGSASGSRGASYRFSLVATPGTADAGRVALKVWHTDAGGAQRVDYDNQAGTKGATGGAMVEGRIAVQL